MKNLDGNENKLVNIGNQTWMTENLSVSHFRNGDTISEAKTAEEWTKAGKNRLPAWCYYDNDTRNGISVGKLYNWYAVNDSRGLAPEGWHISSNNEWVAFIKFLGGPAVAAPKVLSSFISPGGYRSPTARFLVYGYYGFWWTSTEQNTGSSYCYSLIVTNLSLTIVSLSKANGFSVRCIKD